MLAINHHAGDLSDAMGKKEIMEADGHGKHC